ncbi:nitrogen fixation protein NifQ [Rhodoplanes sp. TEM]|uniref:Nitrogen fixation protein NifQ n=1 Tax=Rhodoplanes tepidamans TaxID=200616 RepID=A0ABT5JFM1_RHOTP|nr:MULTISPECIES: nitrogen fixation protein NifQ [Rhodoplanes]MDC7788411.1 nitrogen fixation protein NifQ [Rhodoplanes tepidamans]MDC7985910.1 nitrogen fixation protein NifQ [Rhodoplanes sp. TEM]MDQ0357090.1 nitrogen fixation protein NifQ [Rhodoplanes tepidamans]
MAPALSPGLAGPVPPGFCRDAACSARSAAAIYRGLTGWWPAEVSIHADDDFDTHVFASLIAVAASEGGAVHLRLGLSAAELRQLLDRRFPGAAVLLRPDEGEAVPHDEEVAMVHDLLLAYASDETEDSRRLAAMIARRAVEPNHLWEDLGLRNRGELTRLMERHFGALAAKNVRNMRWKRFFYRTMCETDGFVMCATPVCSACPDFDACFGEETGESRLARARRDAGAPTLS